MEWENGVLGSIFVPDVLTPEQYYDSRRDDSRIAPVKRLMMAVLEDALRCFQNNADAKSGQRKRLFAEAEAWLCGEEGDGPFSFETAIPQPLTPATGCVVRLRFGLPKHLIRNHLFHQVRSGIGGF